MRILITGGAGFIGGHLVERCLAAGHHVRVLDDLSSGLESNCGDAELRVGSVTDIDVVTAAATGCELVFHLAALRSVPRSVSDPLSTDRVNTGGTLSVLEASKRSGVRRVVVTSSSSVYGGVAPLPTPEAAALTPRSPYAVSKVAGENYARVFNELSDLETVIARPFNVYGPRQQPDDPYAGVISVFLKRAVDGKAPMITGDGTQSRDFTFVSDAVDLFLRIGEAPAQAVAGQAFNVAAGNEINLLELWAAIRAVTGIDIEPKFAPSRPGDVKQSRADITAAVSALGYTPKTSVENGLRLTFDWLRDSLRHSTERNPTSPTA